MKILFISDVYFPRVNGVSTSIETFRRNLRELGHTVHLIAPEYASRCADETDIVRIPARQLPFDPEDYLMRYGVALQQLERLREEKYDLIHIQTPFVAHYLGLKLSKLLKIPCVETYHTFFEAYLHHYLPLLPNAFSRSVAQRISRQQGNRLHGMIVPSYPMLAILKSYGITTAADVIATGIEAQRFIPGNRSAFREKFGIPQERPTLLFVGRVAHEKNIDFLLQVVAQVRHSIPEILFVIAGEGPAKESLTQQVAQLKLQDSVQFIGYLDRSTELNSCYCAADIFVFSSRTETQGLVLLEAMAQGVPVVSTAELGTKDVLREGQGVWIAREELSDFSNKIIQLLNDKDAQQTLSELGREYAHTWSAQKQAEKMLAFYERLRSNVTQATIVSHGSSR